MSAATPTNRKVIGLAIAGAVGGFLFGFDSSVVNGAVDAIRSDFSLGAALTGFAVAVALLGCAVGAVLAGRLADRLGRVPVMLIGSVLFIASAIGAAFAGGVADLILWRVIGGLGIGIASVIAPAYIAEISPSDMRGRLGSLQQLAITVGIFAALLSDAVFADAAGGATEVIAGLDAWRWMFLVGVVPGVVYGVLALRLPESPRYLVLKGHEAKARVVFEKYWPGQDADAAIGDIRDSLAKDAEAKRTGTLLSPRTGLKPIVWIGIALSVFQQFVGINVIFYYSTELWSSVGFPESASFGISVATGIVNIAVTLVAIALVDRVGRRPILLTGSLGMAVSLGVMALAFSQATVTSDGPQLEGAWGPVALVAANIFVIAFGVSWGPLVWVLLGEIFPNSIRAKALGVAAGAQWIANFVVTVSFPSLSAFSLPLTYGAYAIFAALSFLFVLRLIPETKGTSLEDADTLLDRGARSGGADPRHTVSA
ncbi:sugar porter (SP) family MFS transporter [Microbacteriaceae bacterium SG_E_30_P1]|uniref:Sugar porter (SP) family MFS transporter n=1 Tax=Antiquaquibacter oligotrophicus TaxID=2880260 RepID=A0ABT6KNI1_9MICO|nr:sugar porter family MFS transporter [Antiquaquibacter oligotrophicus]MDH6181315.1 sugar porter (SP) family MFS transporter [Antiquaquibacter oligotrophicus]UDF12992.1 sugar porter family MFS transporter [Antiquaquibacter oligotrophicus]